MRHGLITDYDPSPGVAITALSYDYPAGFDIVEHAHGSDQLIFATTGVMEVMVARRMWLVPPQFAIWVPAHTMHRIRISAPVSMRTLYVRTSLASRQHESCAVLFVSPLLRELILEVVRLGSLHSGGVEHRPLRQLLLERIRTASLVQTTISLPSDPRALSVAVAAMEGNGRELSFRELCAAANASVRTVQRAFQRDVGLSFENWRRQARLIKAIELLASGQSVKEAGYAVGYRGTSSFVQMFRESIGTTPARWLRELGETAGETSGRDGPNRPRSITS